ncbi:MAG: sugar transferase [Thermoguttaceae bacterium]|jgi:lipopolysaccharide/colanic/teichoic acid biosynthesis glycosyltransferase
MKRLLDIVVAAAGLLLLSPLWLAVACAVKLTSSGSVLFRQERMGRRFRPFLICKFRTMIQDAPRRGAQITCGADPRITPVGRFLRKTKLDELPQLFNVLNGEMSLVGPRPEVRRYVELFAGDYAEILEVRPGITDLASIKYRHEAEVLGRAADPEKEYATRILPEKIRLAKEYVRRRSLWLDLVIIFKTILALPANRTAEEP